MMPVEQRPHFTIVGAGAIGGGIGAHLARAGYPVLFVDGARDHVDAINGGGLHLEGVADFTVCAQAVTPDGLADALGGRRPEVVLLAVKAQHTAAALEPVARLLDDRGVVVSLQNGLNERVIAARIGAARTIGSFVNWGGDYLAPGRLLFSSRTGEFYLGELDGRMTPRLEMLGRIFREHFLAHTQLTDNIWGYLWGKLGYGSMLFAGATVDDTAADVLVNPRYRPMLANVAGEVVRVADAEGVRSEGFAGFNPNVFRFVAPRDWAGIYRTFDERVEVNRRSLKPRSGIWRDLAVRHRPTEVDAQPGAVIETARRRGLRVPLHERIVAMIHDLEAERRSRTPANLEELCEVNAREYPLEHPPA